MRDGQARCALHTLFDAMPMVIHTHTPAVVTRKEIAQRTSSMVTQYSQHLMPQQRSFRTRTERIHAGSVETRFRTGCRCTRTPIITCGYKRRHLHATHSRAPQSLSEHFGEGTAAVRQRRDLERRRDWRCRRRWRWGPRQRHTLAIGFPCTSVGCISPAMPIITFSFILVTKFQTSLNDLNDI